MKKSAKLTLNRETLVGLNSTKEEMLLVANGGNTQNTCFLTCNCRSAYTCYWSDCGCSADGWC